MVVEPAVVVDGLLFPESPRWHEGSLWFSDMYAGRVCRWDAHTRAVETVVELDDRPSGIGWLPDGTMLVVSMSDRRILRLDPTGLSVHSDLRPFVSGDANDMVVGPSGRAYAGNFGAGYAEGREVEPGGELVRRSEFASLPEIPDGIAADEQGGVWVALPLAQEFIRLERGGNVTLRISVAPRGAFACALGGTERRTLFMCSASGTPDEIRNKRSMGQILAVSVDSAGCGWP